MVVFYISQVYSMAVFGKCPLCEETTVVKPELVKNNNKVFMCENGHQFKISPEMSEKDVSQDIWNHMPEWARMLNEFSNTDK